MGKKVGIAATEKIVVAASTEKIVVAMMQDVAMTEEIGVVS